MSISIDNIDDQIHKEIERIAREVIEWEQPSTPDHGAKLRWKSRYDTEHFVQEGDKRLIPTDLQAYYDLQLSRGASRPKDPTLQWEFVGPEQGVTKRAAINTERFDHFVHFFPITSETRMLEIGTRNGQFLYYLWDKGYRCVAGVDCVKLNVLWCQKNGLDVREIDAHELSKHLPPDSYDVIFAYSVLEHCYDPVKVLAECRAVLSPLGGLHIEIPISGVDPNTAHCYGFRRGELCVMLKSQGYDVLNYVYRNRIERVVARKQAARSGSLLARFRDLLWKKR